jgi:glucose/arabinose dehydrogenase/Ca2+-binding RTX toxin-like protein
LAKRKYDLVVRTKDLVAAEDGARTPQLLGVWAALLAAILVATILILLVSASANAAPTLPSGFQEEVVLRGLSYPTNVEFSKDGRVFVVEKRGLIKVFDDLSDTTPTTFADLRANVYDRTDRGMLGFALDPDFPTKPYVYVLYTHDAAIGGTAPRWSDACPDPPGAQTDGCVVSGHLSKLTASGDTMTGPEQVLIEDWCQQYGSHSIGDLAFGADGALYVSGGEGASFTFADYGQGGGSPGSPTPKNPCGDPPGGVGATLTPPTAEGGALRSQDLRKSGDPVGLSGAILRVDPATGTAMPGNPLIGQADANAKRIVAHGFRNPFRFTMRPGTSEVWLGDVGWGKWEEINRITDPTGPTVENFGWPCYEGNSRQPSYDSANLNICENLYAVGQTAVATPYYTYSHAAKVVSGESCGTGSSSVSGMAFYQGGSYPSRYDGALFFADYSRNCIWAMEKGSNGLPDPTKRSTFVAEAANPVDLEIGPGGDLFYTDLVGGTIRRIKYFDIAANQPPVARATATPTSGPAPLTVSFDGTTSSDPEGDALSYEWDLDGDGAYNDSSEPQPSRTYSTGSYQVGLRVTDGRGASDTLDQALTISAGNTPPSATISAPLSTTTWKVGDTILFSGSATDEEEGALPAEQLTWSLIMHHCPSDCHEHPEQIFAGVESGSFVTPDHEYPSYLELRLTATDSGGLTDTESVRLDPKTVVLSFQTNPTGLRLAVGSSQATTPFSRAVIVGSANSISAPTPQTLTEIVYAFASWSDGGAQTHNVVAGTEPSTYTATYRTAGCTIAGTSAGETLTGTSGDDVICAGGGNDTIKGLEGSDILKGEGGNDTLLGGVGDDTLDGGLGTDKASYSASLTAVTASLATNSSAGEGSDTFSGVENLLGSPKADTLTGSAANNTLTGGGGSDTESGGAGSDKVVGGGGADTLRGEDGADTINSKDGVNGNDSLDGGAGTDTKVTDTTEKSIVGFP